MPHLTYAELISRKIPLAPSEAAALTLAVAKLLDTEREASRPAQLPDSEWIILSSSGQVSLVDVRSSTDVDETTGLSRLLRRLLHVDEGSSAEQAIPGGLLLVLARTLGHIDLPSMDGAAFRAALERFARIEQPHLAAVFWRAAQIRPEVSPRVNVSAAPSRRRERRHSGQSREDLRRALRDAERDLFALRAAGDLPGINQQGARGRRTALPMTAGVGWTPLASTLTASLVAVMLVAVLAFVRVPAVTHGTATSATSNTPIVRGPAVEQLASSTDMEAVSPALAVEPVPSSVSRPNIGQERAVALVARRAERTPVPTRTSAARPRRRVPTFAGGTRPILWQ